MHLKGKAGHRHRRQQRHRQAVVALLALAGDGANVVIDYVSPPAATEDLERQVEALGDQAIGVACRR